MNFQTTKFDGLLFFEPVIFTDERGVFFESFNKFNFNVHIPESFLQDNVSISRKNVIRGLHFQRPPFAQGKLVNVLHGSVIDVVVDLRRSSATFGQSYSMELSALNRKSLYIPPGFAHGFAALEDNTIFSYKCTNVYNRASEGGILFNDPVLHIDWKTINPIVSEKDLLLPCLNQLESLF